MRGGQECCRGDCGEVVPSDPEQESDGTREAQGLGDEGSRDAKGAR